ncbi:MAG: DUF4307 domain-containing protein [Actinomycetes bacterium]
MSSPGVHARYGRRRDNRPLLVAGALLAVVAVAWVVWAGVHAAARDLGVTSISYRVTDDSHVAVRYQLQVSRDQATICTLQAKDAHQDVVGQSTVRIPPRPTGSLTETRQDVVRTTSRATTGLVDTCQRQ